jgi:hypothetical protein
MPDASYLLQNALDAQVLVLIVVHEGDPDGFTLPVEAVILHLSHL